MAIFCIGDIHGAADALDRLLDRLSAEYDDPTFWFVGDLVNRGPDSLGVLRRVRALGERAITVLGNHDLSLLALAQRNDAIEKAKPGLREVLEACDGDALLAWLRHRPLLHRDPALDWTMVHAGIPPSWTVAEAQARAQELEAALRGPDHRDFLAGLYGNTPSHWAPELSGIERLRYIANALTRQRFITPDGGLDMDYKKTLADAPSSLVPWFAWPNRAAGHERIVFGHWSALEQVAWPQYRVWGIDTGAAWGGQLSALRLDSATPYLVQVEADAP
ncbi:diadenosine tetraphosphatase [Salinisphaera sp. T5B8]|uniref:symmetrical bis(5'-nucleosyl)-tetraphosphatase n=1 Tax=Salinisphaera sp. T5B8 TaxID=1304154 RepID=UPI003342E1C5